MNFNDHSKLKGQHSTLSASKHSWLNYDPNKLAEVFFNSYAQTVGTILHDLACTCITHKIAIGVDEYNLVIFTLKTKKVPDFVIANLDIPKITLNLSQYVNDAIALEMQPEQILYYSDNCFGTADAISYNNKVLRIHDLKTGATDAKMEQLMIYAALFFLEYNIKPTNVKIELRIYQFGDVIISNPDLGDISAICKKIVESDTVLNSIKSGGVK